MTGMAGAVGVAGVALALAAGATPVVAQDGWNQPRVVELVERARHRRAEPAADSALRNYRADVTGHIYFFLDREDEPEPVLLRADQVALELYWARPDRVKQVIRGMRSEEQFPLRDFRYYLDRYTVIQNGFDDVIRVGEGRDVRNAIHPLSSEGRFFYDFRMGDSTTIRLPGQPDPIRVYEVQVRPRDFDSAAIVGSLYLERAQADLVRMAFTFTPASYIDPRNERVEIVLENALWEGTYWLPREQRLLVRREMPDLDLDVGTVIRGALRVEDYDLNTEIPPGFFSGAEVVMAAGPEGLAQYEFREGLYEGFEAVGLGEAEPGTLDEVDVAAIRGQILRERFLRGVPAVRFFSPTTSDIVRFDRAEGLVTGAGVAFGIGRSQAYVYGGWAWGSGVPLARIGWQPAGPESGARTVAELYLNRPRPVGLRQATAGLLSSASAALLGRDYRDIVPVSGGMVGRRWGDGRTGRSTLSATLELYDQGQQAWHHAPTSEDRLFRPVTPATQGSQIVLAWERMRRGRTGPATVSLTRRAEVGAALGLNRPEPDASLVGEPFVRLLVDGTAAWRDGPRRTGVEGRATVGAGIGDVPPHQLWYIGGPGTVPGHPFHAFAGSVAGVADLTVWRSVVPRYLRLRAFGALGWAGGQDPPDPAARVGSPDPLASWTPGGTSGPAASVGLGVGLVDGLLTVDYARPLGGGDGRWVIAVDSGLWSFL